MINLYLGNNEVFVTLRERSELTDPDILISFVFRNETSKEKILKTTDSSLATDRVNKIAIEVVSEGEEDLENGKIELIPGDYEYKIYESDDGTLNIEGKKLLENGVLNYHSELSSDQYQTEQNETIYNG